MSYTALYRKFRPDNFEDVKGQDHIVTTLTNQIKASRIGHAYLFCGTRGTGKTTVAKILAKAVNCKHPVNGSPCNECEMCKAIQAGTSMNVIEIDAASNNGVDNIREIREEVAYRPTEGNYKVYIIDEVHMLSTGAFNALLKTLEEPPAYVIFILATTEAHKIPITILSRCQRYDFHRISIDTISARLEEARDVSSENLKLLKEESQMVDTETLMRYIRVFSDLSSQIRYATQKRVLIEIGLIKLCRPAMETNLDSVLDRLRVLEQRIDEGAIVQQTVVQSGGVVQQTGAQPAQEEKKPAKAAPEDLQKIVAGWRAIAGQTTGVFRDQLLKAVPKYNGDTGEPVLYVEFQDFLGKNYVDDPEARQELMDIIAAQTGKAVEVQLLVANNHLYTNLSKVTVDEAIRQKIHMYVVIEED